MAYRGWLFFRYFEKVGDVFCRNFGDVRGFSWDFREIFHGFSCFCWWISMDFHGFPSICHEVFFLVIFFVTATEAVGVPPLCGDAAWLLGLLLHSWLGVPCEIFATEVIFLGNWFPNIIWDFSHQSLGKWSNFDESFSNGLVKNHQLVFQKPPKPIWGERDLLSTADETLLSAEVGIVVYMRITPRTQDSSPHQDYEPFLGAGIPTETFIGDWNPGCGVDQSHVIQFCCTFLMRRTWIHWHIVDTVGHLVKGYSTEICLLVCTEHCVEQKLLEGL